MPDSIWYIPVGFFGKDSKLGVTACLKRIGFFFVENEKGNQNSDTSDNRRICQVEDRPNADVYEVRNLTHQHSVY